MTRGPGRHSERNFRAAEQVLVLLLLVSLVRSSSSKDVKIIIRAI